MKAKKVTINGRPFSSRNAAARHYGVSELLLRDRIHRGWTLKQALGLSPRPKVIGNRSKSIVIAGQTFHSRSAAADHFGIHRAAFRTRLDAGWTPEEAAEIDKRSEYVRASLGEAAEAAKDRGGRLLSKQVSNTKERLKWRCNCGHKFPMSLGGVRRGLWCRRCRSTLGSRGERVTRAFFETLFDAEFPSSWPEWLRGLELDGFNESLSIAFEHQGKQHYGPVASRGGAKTYRAIKQRDRLKARLCQKRGVRLAIVPEIGTLLPLNELRSFIVRECMRLGCEVPAERQHLEVALKDAYTTNDEMDKLADVKRVAKSIGVEILADAYFRSNYPMPARCKKCGHEWPTSAGRITISRAGCQKCARQLVGRKNRKSISIGDKQFPSVTAALEHFGTPKTLYESRRSRGCTLEACFGAVPAYGARKKDGYIAAGKQFDSVASACRYFGTTKITYQNRRDRGCSFEVCCGAVPNITTNNAQAIIVDGKRFDSIEEACSYFGVDSTVYHARKAYGHPLTVCLQIDPLPPRRPKGPTKPLIVAGKTFPSIKAACDHYKISRDVYKQRRRLGHTVEVSIGLAPLPPRPLNSLARTICIAGRTFESVTSACKHYGVPTVTYYRRLGRGLTVSQALGLEEDAV